MSAGNEEEVTAENNTSITIYPNPSTNNEFNILMPELQSGDTATVTVTNINGRRVFVSKHKGSVKINHNLAAGIYLITISSNIFNVSKKLIVR